jgi:hypothetical protein
LCGGALELGGIISLMEIEAGEAADRFHENYRITQESTIFLIFMQDESNTTNSFG